MAKKEPTLKEIMDEVLNKQPSTPATPKKAKDEESFWDNDACFAPDLDELFSVPPEPPKPIDLEACIKETLEKLSIYRLTDEELQLIREFLTLHIQTSQNRNAPTEAARARYNLLLHGDEGESVHNIAKLLQQALRIAEDEALYTTERELLQKAEAASSSSSRRTRSPFGENNSGSELIPPKTRFILIDRCQEKPALFLDGGSSLRDASRKAIADYDAMWAKVFQHVRNTPHAILIVSGSDGVYRSTLRPFEELAQRVCCHHIHLLPRSTEDLFDDCLQQLQSSCFALAEDFTAALRSYFMNAYPTSRLQGQAFISDLIDQVYTLYYACRREDLVLTADCVPQVDLLAQSAESILGKLDSLVGLDSVKTEFRNFYRMQVAGLGKSENMRYHMLFSGNPGTGKTTVARLAADLFFRMGIIKTNKLVTVKPCDLISEWIGGTGTKAMDLIRKAYNGVLFIDEAYGIATMDRGEELLNIILQEMENNGHKLIVIFAGYTDEMRTLLKKNPGLASRIGQELVFEDYSRDQLVQIFLQMSKQDGFTVDPSALDELEDCISALMTKEFFSNARDVRNMLQDVKEVWSEDYYEAYQKDNTELEREFKPHHFLKIMPPKKDISINDLVGLDSMKQQLAAFKNQAIYQKHLREKGFTDLTDFSMHMVFTGNPGTGKTTVARLIADDLYSIGMLRTNRLVVVEKKDLLDVYGNTGKKTAEVVRKAQGGVLFIDEAYALTSNRNTGSECIETLLTAMEARRGDTVFIFAGYNREMQEFLAFNPGLQSRIGYTFHFEDYSSRDLTRMYAQKMKKAGFLVEDSALDRVYEIMEYFRSLRNFGNGRFVNHVIHQTISQRAARDFSQQYRDISEEDIPSFKTLIDTAPNSMQLYDPAEISPEQHKRTAFHELGHAMVLAETKTIPETISIRNRAGSLGRVIPGANNKNNTEHELFFEIATNLAGKNAEKLMLGDHCTGCSSDYERAKWIAEDMVQKFAMTTFGNTPEKIIEEADALATKILTRNKAWLEKWCEILLEKKELTGEELFGKK